MHKFEQKNNCSNQEETLAISWQQLASSMQVIQSFSKLSALPKSHMALASPAELDLLSRLALSQVPLTPFTLSQQMGMKKSAISRLITSLLQHGYLEKEISQLDKRSYHLHLTKKGHEELDKNYQQMLQPVICIYKTLGEENFHTLISILEQANLALSIHKQNSSMDIEV